MYCSKNDPSRGNFMRGIDCAYSRILKMLPWPWFREKLGFWSKIFRFSQFRNPIFSLNQGQGSIFTLRECAQSISRIKLPLEKSFLQKFKKNFFCKKLLEIFVTKCKKIWFIAVNKIIFLCKKYSEGSWKYFFWILQYHFYNTEKNRIKNGFS